MHQPQDGVPLQRVAYSNPITQAGFTQIPNVVMLRDDLSPGAKLTYGYLGHLAWRNGHAEIDPPREVVAADLGITEKTVTAYIKELREAPTTEGDDDPDAPCLIEVHRRGQGRTNSYTINDPGLSRKVASTLPDSPDLPDPARGRVSGSRPKRQEEGSKDPSARGDNPPPLTMVDGRNLGLDALTDETGVAQGSPRYPQAVVALNGRRTPRSDVLKEPGIRHLFWRELLRWAEEHDPDGDPLAALDDDPERFERALEKGIRRKAGVYRERMPGAALTPNALRDWWLDVENLNGRQDAGLTADEMARFGE